MTERTYERDRPDARLAPGAAAAAAGDPSDDNPAAATRDLNPDAITTGGPAARDRSIGSLVKELRDEFTTLLRQELALAKTEMSEKASKASRNATYIAVGGAICFAGVLFLLVGVSAAVYVGLVYAGLSHYVAGWLAPVIVGAVVAIVGYAMLQKGISTLKRMSVTPDKTVESLKEDKQWLQNQATHR